jgi:hypothetical protein
MNKMIYILKEMGCMIKKNKLFFRTYTYYPGDYCPFVILYRPCCCNRIVYLCWGLTLRSKHLFGDIPAGNVWNEKY